MEFYRKRYLEAKQADDARNTLIEDLLQKVDDMQKTMERNAFVLVLIDGDNMNVRTISWCRNPFIYIYSSSWATRDCDEADARPSSWTSWSSKESKVAMKLQNDLDGLSSITYGTTKTSSMIIRSW